MRNETVIDRPTDVKHDIHVKRHTVNFAELIATGDPKDLQGASVMIEQMDSLGAQPERKMKVLPIKAGRVAELTSKVRQLYQDQAKNLPELGVSDAMFLEDPASNQMIVTGTDAQMKVIERIIQELQSSQAGLPARETAIYDLGSNDELQRLQPMVQQLYKDRW